MRSNLVDIEGAIHHETDKAVLFSESGEQKEAVWLPKSIVEVEYKSMLKTRAIVTMPESYAIDKGLV